MSATDQFGPYKIIAPLSQTGFSVSHGVEIAVRPRVNRLATLTLIRPELSAQSEFAAALLESVRQTELLNHPNITRMFDYGARGEHHYCVSEFVAGPTLKSLLQHPSLTDEIAVYIVSQLAIAVAHAHTRRDEDGQRIEVIHGDIRPAHVTIMTTGAIKLGGYAIGSARAALEIDPVPTADQASDLYAYTEPARAQGEALSITSDLFSLGALLWSLLAGRPLFEGADAQRTQENAKEGVIPGLQSLRPDLDSDLADIVMSTLGQTPEGARPVNSAQSLRSGLSAWLRSQGHTIGRPQLKDAFDDTFDAMDVFGRTRPITQREFVSQDPHSLIHTPEGDVQDPGVTVDIDSLWTVELADGTPAAAPAKAKTPAPAAAPPAPKAPTPPQSDARKTTAFSPADFETLDEHTPSDDDQRDLRKTTAFSPADFETLDEHTLSDDDQTVEYSQLDDADRDEIALDLDMDIVSEERSDEYDAPKTPSAPPAPSSAPKPPPAEGEQSKAGLASVLAASRASQALRGGRDPGSVGKPISSKELPKRPALSTPPASAPAAPKPPTPKPKSKPETKPAKKGSISFEDIPTTDSTLFGGAPSQDAEPEEPTAAEYAPIDPVPDTPEPETHAADAADVVDEAADATAAPEPTSDAQPEAPAQPRDDEPTEKKSYEFDPTAVYDEDAEITDYVDPDDDSEFATVKKKRGIVIPLLAALVIGLVGYIAYSTFFAEEQAVVEERPSALRVESTPGRAHIFIDGEDTGELTPHTFNDLPPDSRVSVSVQLQGYEVADAVGIDLESGQAASHRFELSSLKHTINLSSTPQGATVYIDGDAHGTTPTVIGPIEANPTLGVNIHLQLDGYRPRAIQHTWLGDERTSDVNMELEKL